jgi:holo-[acyl-carrier protein] synthase
MIYGIGTDIIEISRIAKAMQKKTFFNKAFTKLEKSYIISKTKSAPQSAAGIFVAKEAVVKALGTGFSCTVKPSDVEISHDSLGKPIANIVNDIDLTKKIKFHVSISHCKEYATAFAIAELIQGQALMT